MPMSCTMSYILPQIDIVAWVPSTINAYDYNAIVIVIIIPPICVVPGRYGHADERPFDARTVIVVVQRAAPSGD